MVRLSQQPGVRFKHALNRLIQPHYFARLTPYVTYEVVEVGQVRSVRPDVGVLAAPNTTRESQASTATIAPAPVESLVTLEIPLRLHRVEMRATASQQLVTVVEILSPVNKRPSHDAYLAYQRKRRDILRSERCICSKSTCCGRRTSTTGATRPRRAVLCRPQPCQPPPDGEVWPIQLADRLPVLPVPLLEPDPDVPLDLGAVVASVYERGAYASQLDYQPHPPPPALSKPEADWLRTLLHQTR